MRYKTVLRVKMLVVLLMILSATVSHADDGLPPLPETVGDRDLTLTVHGRSAVYGDKELEKFTLFIQVKKGTAEVRGRVDSEEQALRAMRLLQDVPGILAVRNYLEIRPLRNQPERLVLDPEEPSSTRAALPNRNSYPDLSLSIPPPPSRAEPAPRKVPPVVTAAPAFQVELLAPVFNQEPRRLPVQVTTVPKEQVSTRPGVQAAPVVRQTAPVASARLDAILADPTFRGISVEQRGKVVTIYNQPSKAAAVMALARQVSELPEVEQIILAPQGR